MAAVLSVLSNDDQATVLKITLPVNADSYELALGNADTLALDSVKSLTADEIQVYFSSKESPSAGDYIQYMVNGVNPFSTSGTGVSAPNDFITGIDVRGVKKMKLVRNGSSDGTGVLMNVGLSNSKQR